MPRNQARPIGSVKASETPALQAVWGSGRDDVWAVGEGGLVLHWNGAVWAAVVSNATRALHGACGSGPSDVWVAGQTGAILRYRP
jgi:hypothetical protein